MIQMKLRSTTGVLAVAVVTVATLLLIDPASADHTDFHEEAISPGSDPIPDPQPDEGDGEPDPPPPAAEVDPDAPVCEWSEVDPGPDDARIGLLTPHIEAVGLAVPDRPSEEHVFRQLWCEQNEQREDGTTRWLEDAGWIDPNAEEGDPAAVLREELYARVAGNLPAPEITANPPVGRSWIVNAPTFVRVDNWEDHDLWDDDGIFRDEACDGPDFCVYIEADPALVFDPGDGTEPIGCAAPGVLFDQHSHLDPFQQHELDGTCSHIYEHRSGIDGRPDQWPGEVRLVWSLIWWDDTGASGTYDPITHQTDLPREVNEVSTTITN